MEMKKVGIALLPLHYGKAPYWLMARMKQLAGEIIKVITRNVAMIVFKKITQMHLNKK
ncbi:MAG: DUF763 domain-containing protein [Candidatus Aenigmarchaeota archaeon]|nr:DUF763 domain-containing protein [Candidatus Aenigmarchaeota archaeon]